MPILQKHVNLIYLKFLYELFQMKGKNKTSTIYKHQHSAIYINWKRNINEMLC